MAPRFDDPPPAPPSALGRHRVLSPRASVRVSPLCLGGMSLGTAWSNIMNGGLDEAGSHKLLDYFYDEGGNFIDTANSYQDGQSEEYIGSWMKKRGNREEIVLATKYTTCWKDHNQGAKLATNYVGNSSKSLRHSLDASLKKLQTDYVDILYLHWWDWTTGVEEVMQSLNQLVQAGKVLYLGISDSPAWVAAKANMYARAHGLAEFVIYQGMWNASVRDFERDIIPMARDFGMALAPWSALGAGRFRTPAQLKERQEKEGSSVRGGQPSAAEARIAEVLDVMGREEFNGASIAQMALAYVFNKTPYVFPIVGGTKVSHLEDNIKAINITLSAEQLKRIDDASTDFNIGFPLSMIGTDPHQQGVSEWALLNHAGWLDFVRAPKPAEVHKQAAK